MNWKYVKSYIDHPEAGDLAPMVRIKVYHPGEEDLNETLDALVDSGSTICCLPEDVPKRLILIKMGETDVGGVSAPSRVSDVYYLNLKIEESNFNFSAVKSVTWSRDFALIGRNVLSRLYVVLDGLNRKLAITA